MLDLKIKVAGEELLLLPERLAYWPKTATLIAADLHWGKSEVLQRAGIPLPSPALAADLTRLSTALDRCAARRLLVLGDLIHAVSGLTPQVIADVTAWRQLHADVAISIIRGNHDRRLVLPKSWDMTMIEGAWKEEPFRFVHEGGAAAAKEDVVTWSGHLHPAVQLGAGRERLRLPCFLQRGHSFVLPSFGSVTGSMTIVRQPGDQVYAVAGDAVIGV